MTGLLLVVPTCLTLGAGTAPDVDQPQPYCAARESSADRTGGNRDFVSVPGGSSHTVAELAGAGRIVHMWFTIAPRDPDYLRKTRLKIWWDGRQQPAVDVPFGDFHALGHGRVRSVHNAFLSVEARPELNDNLLDRNVAGFNSYFPMPFARGARVVIENTSDQPIASLYYQIDWQRWETAPSPLRFHAWYNESPAGAPISAPATRGAGRAPADARGSGAVPGHATPGSSTNPGGRPAHLVLDTAGRGHFVGVVLSVDAVARGWWEGDDMFWIDGEARPSIMGTGTEDYFGGAWGFRREYNAAYHGVSFLDRVPGRDDFRTGRFTVYRFHEKDPVPFTRSLRMTIERGHANDRGDCGYASVAYWYQE